MAEDLDMYNPCAPGELIQSEYLHPYAISQKELATKLKVAPETVSRLIKAEIDLSADMALRLSVVLGGSPDSWMNMQKNYALWQARMSFNPGELEKVDCNRLPRIEDDSLRSDPAVQAFV